MNEIRLKNFRCFRDEQTARLAPLTLLVGENSTGKTSFLAMIRALWDIARHSQAANFKEAPYDLGSFDDIAHYRGGRGGRSDTFEAGFSSGSRRKPGLISGNRSYQLEVTFGKKGAIPIPVRRCITRGDVWIDECSEKGQPYVLRVGTSRGSWELRIPGDFNTNFGADKDLRFTLMNLDMMPNSTSDKDNVIFISLAGSPKFSVEDQKQLSTLVSFVSHFAGGRQPLARRPYAGAPVRSKPRRTYDPSRTTPDPEGDYVPMYLAEVFFESKRQSDALMSRLEDIGKAAGLFDRNLHPACWRRATEK